jgi:hypothetical protein
MYQVNATHNFKTIAGSGASLTVSTTAVALAAAAVPERAVAIKVQVQAQPVRMTTDGAAPVAATTGDLISAGRDYIFLSRQQALAARFIRDGGTDAVIRTEALVY